MAETSQTFRTTLWSAGGNNVGIVVPPAVIEAFERGKRVPVVVTIDGGYQYRNTIASMGGQFLISFNAETRKATGRGAGDDVEVRLDVDDAPRVIEVPADLAAELGRTRRPRRHGTSSATATSGPTPSRSPVPRPRPPAPSGSPRSWTRCDRPDAAQSSRPRRVSIVLTASAPIGLTDRWVTPASL